MAKLTVLKYLRGEIRDQDVLWGEAKKAEMREVSKEENAYFLGGFGIAHVFGEQKGIYFYQATECFIFCNNVFLVIIPNKTLKIIIDVM